MAHGEISELLPAPSTVIFDVLHDYGRRLEWGTLLRAAYWEAGHLMAGEGVISVCVGRRSLGGRALRTFTSRLSARRWRRSRWSMRLRSSQRGRRLSITKTSRRTNRD